MYVFGPVPPTPPWTAALSHSPWTRRRRLGPRPGGLSRVASSRAPSTEFAFRWVPIGLSWRALKGALPLGARAETKVAARVNGTSGGSTHVCNDLPDAVARVRVAQPHPRPHQTDQTRPESSYVTDCCPGRPRGGVGCCLSVKPPPAVSGFSASQPAAAASDGRDAVPKNSSAVGVFPFSLRGSSNVHLAIMVFSRVTAGRRSRPAT